MKKNVGTIDKVIRVLFAIVVAILYFTGTISGTLAIVLGIAAIAMIITSMVSFCGLYALLGISTCPAKKKS